MAKTHIMKVLDASGDRKYTWDPKVATEVKEAKSVFDGLIRDNQYLAFGLKGTGETTPLQKFDPEQEEVIMTPQLSVG